MIVVGTQLRWLCILLLICGSSLIAGALTAQEKPAASPPVPTFDGDVRPILQAKCWRCHGPTVQKADLSLHTKAGIQKGGESGEILVPGKAAESHLFELIEQGEMPPDKKDPLTKEEVELIRRWIDSGAPLGSDPAQTRPELSQHDVLPILLLRCTVCHGRHKQEGELDLRTRAAMLKGGKSGPAIVPGKPEESLMLKRVRAEEMPPHKRLIEVAVKPMEPDEVATLEKWIALGAPEAADEPDLAGMPEDPLVRPQDKEFWSFRPPQVVAIPSLASGSEILSPVDAFIAQRLTAKNLSFSAEADRLTLLRRASFDLTGLPPEPVEAQAFLADESPDAYEKVIDRLLASPRYGERWGRHWLDVAGYADCEGRREQHLPRPDAWRYRDYVIRAFNSDKPYDRFLQEQLAGDELADYAHATEITQQIEDNLVATAFLRMAPDPTWANLTGFVPDRLEVMADAVDMLGSGIMGLTFKCCRCHSHKFDPIPQRDYYRLVAIFKGAYDEHDWLKPGIINYGGAFSAGIGERYLPYVTTQEQKAWQEHEARISEQIAALQAAPKTPDTEKGIKDLEARRLPQPRLMALWDRGEPSPTYVYRRGNYLTAGGPVPPGLPAVLTDGKTPFTIEPPFPGANSTGRRLAFARWLTEPDQPLTSRVMVNRIWKHHFGHGIVRSLGNFGKTGDHPSHPELLDFLAREFVGQGWSVKTMQRKLMLSRTYRQQSVSTPALEQADSDNRLLSRMPLRRMAAEELRDTLLLIAGELSETRGGPAEAVQVRGDGLVQAGKRRSVYAQQLRKHPPSLLESFDLPAMNPNCLQRSDSLVATQALHLWNDAGVRTLASQFADRVRREAPGDATEQIRQMYWIALSRPPNPDEEQVCWEMLAELIAGWSNLPATEGRLTGEAAEQRALATLCHTLMNSAGFLYID